MTDEFDAEREDFGAWVAANAPNADRNTKSLCFRAWCAALGKQNSVPKTKEEQAESNASRASDRRSDAARLRAELETARAEAADLQVIEAEERAKLKAVADADLQAKADAEAKARAESDAEKDAEMERMREELAALHAAEQPAESEIDTEEAPAEG